MVGSFLHWRGAMARGPAVYRSQLIVQLRRVWGVYFAHVNARLKLARVHRCTAPKAAASPQPPAAGVRTRHARAATPTQTSID